MTVSIDLASREAAKQRLLDHLRSLPVMGVGKWTRDEMNERGE